MKIKRVSCDQFAGVRGMDLSFDGGINVVFGENESGKSTLVNLLFAVMFRKTKLDGRRDKDFSEKYFPSVAAGKTKLDSIDGKLWIESDRGTYTLTKIWDKSGGSVVLSTPDGVFRDGETIDELLKEALGYGEGVYGDMLFSSQRGADEALKSTLESGSESQAKTEIADVLTRAFFESDGVSLDALQKKIEEKIEDLMGDHWDAERALPAKKAGGGRWQKGVGSVLEAYYALEDIQEKLNRGKQYEIQADEAENGYRQAAEARETAQKERERFERYAGKLEKANLLKEQAKSLDEQAKRLDEISSKWPVFEEQCKKARKLLTERQDRDICDRFDRAKGIVESLTPLKERHSALARPTDEEVKTARNAQRRYEELSSALGGMNLRAAVKMAGDHRLEVRSLKTGRTASYTEGSIPIDAAVSLSIPGVMELELSPRNVDLESTQAEMQEKKQVFSAVFEKYHVENLDELETIVRQFDKDESEIKLCEAKLLQELGGVTFEELKEKRQAVLFEPRRKEEIEADIFSLVERRDLSEFKAKCEERIRQYEEEFQDIVSLQRRVSEKKGEFERIKEEMKTLQDVPQEYLGVDPERYRQTLKAEEERRSKELDRANEERVAALTRLQQYRSEVSCDDEAAEEAARTLEERKEELGHWLHIKEVFERRRAAMGSSPMHDLAESFSKYLSIISDGKVSSKFQSEEKMDVNVYSDARPMDFEKLSEGTKETVSLAFRLAVLDHLFPKGGGVIVFDDPLCDMDEARTRQAVKLISECALRHQVIFLTCKKETAQLFAGKQIEL